MRSLLLSVLLFFCLAAQAGAQRWEHVFEDTLYHYAYAPGAGLEGIERSLWWDTLGSLPGGRLDYRFGRTWWHDPDSNVYRMGPGVLGSRCVADTLTGDHLFYLRDGSRLLLRAGAGPGETWLADTVHGVSALVETEWEGATPLGLDSLRLLRLTNGDSIIIGKRFGIHVFPQDTLGLFLAGAKGDTIYGVRVPNVQSVYGWQPGDKFYYHFFSLNAEGGYNGLDAIEVSAVTNSNGILGFWYAGSPIALVSIAQHRWMERVGTVERIYDTARQVLINPAGDDWEFQGLPARRTTPGLAHTIIDLLMLPTASVPTYLPVEMQSLIGPDAPHGFNLFPNYIGPDIDTSYHFPNYPSEGGMLYGDSLGHIYAKDVFEVWGEVILVGYERGGVLYGVDTITPVPVGQAERRQERVLAFPNPANDVVHLVAPTVYSNARAQVLNLLGSIVLDSRLEGTTACLNVSALPEGIYNVQIWSTDHLPLTQRLVISH